MLSRWSIKSYSSDRATGCDLRRTHELLLVGGLRNRERGSVRDDRSTRLGGVMSSNLVHGRERSAAAPIGSVDETPVNYLHLKESPSIPSLSLGADSFARFSYKQLDALVEFPAQQ